MYIVLQKTAQIKLRLRTINCHVQKLKFGRNDFTLITLDDDMKHLFSNICILIQKRN